MNQSHNPDVTVVIPTRNRWRMLSTAIDAALCQRDVELEAIVVDDASTDETLSRLAEVSDRRLRVIRQDKRGGPASARNAGIQAARSVWTAFLDDDDVWSPDKLRLQLEKALAADASFVYASAILVDEEFVPIEIAQAPDPDDLLASLLPGLYLPAGASNIMVRTALLRRLGGFDVRLHYAATWDLLIRLSTAGKAASCSDVLVGYVQHPGSMLLAEKQDVREIDYLASKHRALLASRNVELDRRHFSEWVARADRRAGRRLRASGIYLANAFRYRRKASMLLALWALLGEGALSRRIAMRLGQPGTPQRELVKAPDWLHQFR
jgi:glycosyltransferase involved in cell wall biosynthesis